MFFHHRHAQVRRIGDLFVALSTAHESCNFLFPDGEPGESWQPGVRQSAAPIAVATQILALDEEMWSRYAS
jgi:hypothetical protein